MSAVQLTFNTSATYVWVTTGFTKNQAKRNKRLYKKTFLVLNDKYLFKLKKKIVDTTKRQTYNVIEQCNLLVQSDQNMFFESYKFTLVRICVKLGYRLSKQHWK